MNTAQLSPVVVLTARLYLLAMLMLAVVLAPSIAFGQEVDAGDTVAEIRLSALAVTLVVSLFIPILTGIVTKASLASYWKGLITLVLNLVNAAVVGAVVVDGSAVWSEQTLIVALIGMAISVATYLGIYKPASLTSSTNDGKLGPNSGLG